MVNKVGEVEKNKVRTFWDSKPCGAEGIPFPGSIEYFEAITKHRYQLEPFINKYAQFDKWSGKKILEVGCGIGSDLLQFAKAGADVIGIDLSPKSASLAKSQLQAYGYQGDVRTADAESLPFPDNLFDLVYSWGVLHHTPNPEKAISEIHRVIKPGGKICIMIYHRHSLVALQLYLLFGPLAFKPLRSLKEIIADHLESLGTKAYTRAEAREMFSKFKDLKIEPILTPYDLRYRRDRHLPLWLGKIIPNRFGWFMIIQGRKP